MNTVQRIAKNTAALFIAQSVISIFGLILSIFIARELGDVAFGKYTFALAFVAIFAIFSELGYDTLLVRDVARDKTQAKKYLSNILCIRLLLSIIVFISIVITINLMGYPAETKNIVYLFGIYTLLGSISGLFKVTFRAFEKMEYEAGITILADLIRVSLGLLVLFLGYGIMELALIFIISGIFEFLFGFLICEKKFVKPKIEFDFEFLKKSLKTAIPLSAMTIFVLIYIRIDAVMLSVMKGDAVVGWYTAAYGLVLAFKPFSQWFRQALLPLTSKFYRSSENSLKFAYEKSFKYLLIVGLPLSVGISLLADKFILLFYGPAFENSIIALQILSWDVFLGFTYGAIATTLVAINKQNQIAIATGLGALINVALNLILIPLFSYAGAAIATIITGVVLFAMYFHFASKYLYRLPLHRIIISPMLASIVMAIFIYFCNEINLVALIIASSVIYFVMLYMTRGLSSEDIELFKQLIKMPDSKNEVGENSDGKNG